MNKKENKGEATKREMGNEMVGRKNPNRRIVTRYRRSAIQKSVI